MIPVHLNNLEFMVCWENFVAVMPLVYYNTIQKRVFKMNYCYKIALYTSLFLGHGVI